MHKTTNNRWPSTGSHWLRATLAATAIACAATCGAESNEALTPEELADSPGTPVPAAPHGSEPLDITWDDLLPAGEIERLQALYEQAMQGIPGDIIEGSDEDEMVQIGTFNTVAALDSTRVRIPGFVVPLDFALPELGKPAKLSRFLLVPYFGACIHSPPPPPNQIVFVEAARPVTLERLWDPVTVEGVLRTARQDTDAADAAYSLAVEKVAPYDY